MPDHEASGSHQGEAQTEKESPVEPVRKKRRTEASSGRATAKNNRSRAKTARLGTQLPDIPLDVLYEISSYLHPRDLLYLSQTSKVLNEALISKSSRFVWASVISDAKMPPCPEDLNEVQYVQFALGPFCNYCEKTFRKHEDLRLIFGNRKKACKTCIRSKFASISSYRSGDFPSTSILRKSGRRWIEEYYVPPDVIAFESGVHIKDQEERRVWKQERKTDLDKKLTIKWSLKSWLEKEEEREQERRKLIRHPRYHEVVEKLKAAGWTEDLEWLETSPDPGVLANHKNVNISTKLTPGAWEKLEPEVRRVMEKVKIERLQYTRRKRLPAFSAAFEHYISNHAYDAYGPTCADIADQPQASALIFASLSVTVSRQDFDQLMDESFDIMKNNWRASAEEELLKLMEAAMPGATAEDLRSPATAFSCSRCKQWLLFPHVLTHSCVTNAESKFGWDLPTAPWKGSLLKFEHELYKKAKAMVTKLDKAPALNMISLELFECSDCSEDLMRRVFMTWTEALTRKEGSCVGKGHTIQNATLTSEENALKDLYIDLKICTSEEYIVCATCKVPCPAAPYSHGRSFENHQTQIHATTTDIWKEGVDFYRHADTATHIRFYDDFVLNERTDARSLFLRRLNAYRWPSQSKVQDIRTDATFAAEFYLPDSN